LRLACRHEVQDVLQGLSRDPDAVLVTQTLPRFLGETAWSGVTTPPGR